MIDDMLEIGDNRRRARPRWWRPLGGEIVDLSCLIELGLLDGAERHEGRPHVLQTTAD